MAFVTVVFLYFVLPIVVIFFGKWLIALVCILTGDKQGLHDCNLCDKSQPNVSPRNKNWRYEDDWRNYGEGNMF